jgi:predicted SAM-dependent methyltransferase
MTHPREIEDTQSSWLREAKAALLQRDPVDAVNDAEALAMFAQKRLDALLAQHSE